MQTRTTPTSPPHIITNTGVYILLLRPDVNKAPRPDRIQARIIKQCANTISPILCRLFQAFIDSDFLPRDWHTANITPILKKRRPFRSMFLPTCLININPEQNPRACHLSSLNDPPQSQKHIAKCTPRFQKGQKL